MNTTQHSHLNQTTTIVPSESEQIYKRDFSHILGHQFGKK